ncbi:MAG: UPF0262 family protein [Alphaproteobacteria bacterium]|nr:UPF0262 family protein [Alphaproteobacteria bacterium]
MKPNQRIASIVLDDDRRIRLSAQVEHERRVAVHDLLQDNRFDPVGDFSGPFIVHLGMVNGNLVFNIHDESDAPVISFILPLGDFRPLIKDYFVVCESYFNAIKTLSPSQIEAIDMGRRGLHNEGSELLRERLAKKVDIDVDTARRLFTLLCVLQIRA